MHQRERAELARQAYLRAVAVARASSTPRSWGRLLAAARNLRASIPGDVKRGAAVRAHRAPGKEPPAWRSPCDAARRDASPPATTQAPRPDGPSGTAVGAVALNADPPIPRRARWPGLEEDLQRARTLRQQSRRLVMESRRLCAEVAALLGRSPVHDLDATPGE